MIQTAHRHILVLVVPIEPIINRCCVFCPNPSLEMKTVSQGVMPTVTDALLFVS
jgi:hypothetical protein